MFLKTFKYSVKYFIPQILFPLGTDTTVLCLTTLSRVKWHTDTLLSCSLRVLSPFNLSSSSIHSLNMSDGLLWGRGCETDRVLCCHEAVVPLVYISGILKEYFCIRATLSKSWKYHECLQFCSFPLSFTIICSWESLNKHF